MELFTLFKALSENQNAESIAGLQRQLNIQAATINHYVRSDAYEGLLIAAIFVVLFILIAVLGLAFHFLTKRVKRLELALPQKRAD